MLFCSKKSAVLAGAVIVAGSTIFPTAAFAQATNPVNPITPPIPISRLSVIQGRITSIQGNIVTVKTPDVAPYCPPNRACILIIQVGPTFNVDTSRAVFQSPGGSRQTPRPRLLVNDSVVVAGLIDTSVPVVISPRPNPNPPPRPFIAQVISKIVPSNPTPIPLPTPIP